MAEITLSPKLERFCHEIVKGLNQSNAYRTAFKPKRAKATTIHVKASQIMAMDKVRIRIAALRLPVVQAVQWTMQERLQELRTIGRLDPADAFDEHGRPLSIRDMPEHVRRAIASYEVDPEKFVTKIKFSDKQTAAMNYSKLSGDIPSGDDLPPTPSRPRYDFSKLTKEEWAQYCFIHRKTMILDNGHT